MANGKNRPKTLTVNFGGFSAGKTTCRIGVGVDRQFDSGSPRITIEDAEHFLCGSRLDATLMLEDGEPLFSGDKKKEVSGVSDVKRYSVSPDKITFGMTFSIEEMDMDRLLALRNKTGKIVMKRTGDAGEIDNGELDDADQQKIGQEASVG